jgi:hypothetical protein
MQDSRREIEDGDLTLFNACLEAAMTMPDSVTGLRPSYLNFKNVVAWGGTVENGLASAILTLNSDHGPFAACFDFISKYFDKDLDFLEKCVTLLLKSEIIPGFGNPVLKEKDPRTLLIRELIGSSKYEKISETVEGVFQAKGKVGVYSNLAFWCAATAHRLGLPREYASCIPIMGFQLSYLQRVKQYK